jgi:hypothetical protein
MISVLAISVKQEESNVSKKGEFIIQADWSRERNEDIDLWLRNPDDSVTWFRNKETNISMAYRMETGEITPNPNQEIITIRGIHAGEYVLNIHNYRELKGNEPVIVTVTIIKLNPKAELMLKKEILITEKWEQITVTRFIIGSDGSVVDLESENVRFVDLIEDRVTQTHPGSNEGATY